MEKKIKKEIILFLTFIFLLSINLVYAVPDFGSIPPIPDHFSGNVLIDGQNAPIGAVIGIYVNSVLEFNYNITEIGKYNLYVTSGSFGNSIEFKILSKTAGTSTRQGGETITLNLAISTTTSNDGGGGSNGGSGGGGGGSSGGSGGSLKITPNNTQIIPLNSEPESSNIDNKNQAPITSSTILDFVKSGEGIAVFGGLLVVVFVITGVIISKRKSPKWKRN